MTARLLILIVLVAVSQVGAQPRLDAELDRVRSQIKAAVPADQQGTFVERLDRAAAALKSSRTYQAIYLLEAAYEGGSAFAFAGSSGVNSSETFLKKWTELGPPKAHRGRRGRAPAAVDAIADAAEDRGLATYQASRPYAEDAGVGAGLYYLGESYAVMDFAAFVRAASWPAAGRRPAFRSIASELATLDRDMTTKYETMERSNHPTYIRASAALKQARSLNDHGAFEGALFEYLLSRYLFAPLRGVAPPEATPETLAAVRSSLPAAEDHTIAQLFIQFAEEGLSSDNAALRSGAAAVISDVVPAYSAAIAPPQSTATAPNAAAVTITLVRWPFT